MIRRCASGIAQEHVGKGWVTRFINKHHDQLISRWTSGMDYTHHQADSEARHKLYFDLVHSKMEEYDVLPGNTYNMDEHSCQLSSQPAHDGSAGWRGVLRRLRLDSLA
jgi:hypothetical protein